MGHPRLTDEDTASFVRDGVLIKRQLIEPKAVTRARQLTERWLANSFSHTDLRHYTETTFCPELASHPDVLSPYEGSPARTIAESLVNPNQFAEVTKAQIQIRLPDRDLRSPQPAKPMHVDGVSCPHLDVGELRTFTLLVGILLTDTPDTVNGALRFVRGGHHRMVEWFRRDWVPSGGEQTPPEIADAAGEAFIGRPGDTIFLHHATPHAVGPNLTNRPRIVLYYRLSHESHEQQKLAALRDPWLEFPGLRSLGRQNMHKCQHDSHGDEGWASKS